MLSFLAQHEHLLQLVQSVVRAGISLVVISILFTPLELLFPVRREKLLYKGWGTNLMWYFIGSITPLIVLAPPAAALAWAAHTLLPDAVTGAAANLPLWARMILAMIVGEIGFYWGHRWCHEWKWLWRFHAVHHSAEHISFLVNSRTHPVDQVFTRLCGLVLLYATGLASPVGPNPGLIPSVILLVGSFWSFFIHANVRWRLGPLEEILSSPAFHHWHHTKEDHRDHNYASMLPVMDRVFGTFHLPREWPAEYGVMKPIATTLTGQMLDPFLGERAAPEPSPAAPNQG